MPLLTGPASITRFNVHHIPDEPDFEQARFQAIQPGSELRESSGFIPFEPDAPYEVGTRRYAFRVRIDKLRPDPTAVRERVRDLIKSELEMTGGVMVGPKKRKEFRQLAEEELIMQAVPSWKILECCLDGPLLYIASTSKSDLGIVVQLLRRIEILVEPKTPWIDAGEGEIESELVTTREPGESVRGCRFLKALLGDREILFEPESGMVRLQTRDTRVMLGGAVLKDLRGYLEREMEILSAKLIYGEAAFRFDALSYRLSGLRVEAGRHEHWTELLDERLANIAEVFDVLDRKYGELMK